MFKKSQKYPMEIDINLSYFEFILSMVLLFILIGEEMELKANGIAWVIESAHQGTGFAFASFTSGKQMDMAVSALFPILLIVPLFDILMYFNILPKIIGELAGCSRRLHVSLNSSHSLVLK